MVKKVYTSKEIEEDLTHKIETKVYRPNQKLPTERELMEIYGVSRMTIRNVINSLIAKDIAYRIAGRGAFVQKDFIQKSNQIKGYTQLMDDVGRKPSTKILNFKKVIPDEFTRLSLGLEEREEVFYIERIRYADEIPMCYGESYLPAAIFPDFDKIYTAEKSTYDLIANHYNIKLNYMKRTVSAVKVNNFISQILYEKNNGFALKMEGVVYDENSRPIQYGVSFYNADYFSYVSVNLNK